MKWNPADQRSTLLINNGSLINYYLNKKFDPEKLMGNTAIDSLSTIVCLWICGLHKEIEPILPNTLAWLDFAIEKGEGVGPSKYHRAKLYVAKAMCEWIAHSKNDVDAWQEAMTHFTSKMEEIGSARKDHVSEYLSNFLPACVFAEDYEAGVTQFEKYCGAKTISLKKMLRPWEFAYAVCLHRVRGEFSEEELFELGKKMLRSYVDEEWLKDGLYLDAAIWLKVVYSLVTPELTPMQTLLSVYEVTGEPRPDFVENAQ